MFVRIVIDEIAAGKTTETGPFNDRDEIYFAVAGSSSQSQIEVPRVSPPPPENYYGLKAGQQARNIQLWQGYLGNEEYAFITVVIREQDNAQLGAIAATVKAAALGAAAIFVDPALGPAALGALKEAATEFVNSLLEDGDQNVGAFSVRVNNRGQNFAVDWEAISNIAVASQNGPMAVFQASGSDARYTVRVSVQQPQLPMIVNRNSGKCLDVAGGSLEDQASVQQYTMHGGGNQRWFLKFLSIAPALPVSSWPFPYFAIIADHSGKCLDVAGGTIEDQANIQQYTPHYGPNQSWIMVPVGEDFVLVNLHSRKVLDVADGSVADQAKVQQFTYHGGPDQKWRLQY